MTGLELSRQYWEQIGKPAFAANCPQVVERAAVGLVGEGSECFGFDDEISRDHDWGPGFCVWLTEEDYSAFGAAAQETYAALPAQFEGFRRLRVCEETAGRVGVQTIDAFFARYTGFSRPPQSVQEWRMIPETGLSAVTNGQVFQDPVGEFTLLRQAFLSYYPEPLRLKKLAANCALAAQAGQYNYARCLKRGETVAALQALGLFITHIQQAVFLLNRRYAPYYKWTHRALMTLPVLGGEIGWQLVKMTDDPLRQESRIELICALFIDALQRQGLSDSRSDFLLHHAQEIQSCITDPALRALHLMAE